MSFSTLAQKIGCDESDVISAFGRKISSFSRERIASDLEGLLPSGVIEMMADTLERIENDVVVVDHEWGKIVTTTNMNGEPEVEFDGGELLDITIDCRIIQMKFDEDGWSVLTMDEGWVSCRASRKDGEWTVSTDFIWD